MDRTIESLSANELVSRWIRTENPVEEKKLKCEIEWRLKAGDGEPLAVLSSMYHSAFMMPDRLPPKKGSKILSDMESSEMMRIWNRAKNLLGDDGAEIIRRMDTANPKELLRKFVKTKRENGLRVARLVARR